jgi:hypothetical protein
MHRQIAAATIAFFSVSLLIADITTTHGDLKLIHAKATRTPQKITIKISEPAQDQVVAGPDVTVQFKAGNWSPEKNGKHFHFILDDQPFESHFSDAPFVFRNVSSGPHVIRIFPVYPWHESVKQQNAIAIVQFYVQEKTGKLPLDTKKPMLIYSTPAGTHESNEKLPGQPQPGILVDWFLRNVSMGSKAGYFVRISVDGNQLMSMKEWRPHYIQGLKPGEHRVKLELVHNGAPITGNWSVTERTITVK